MSQSVKLIYKRINVIKRSLNQGLTDFKDIEEQCQVEGIPLTQDILKRDLAGIYRGDYPDPWLDNFLNVVYPEMFKQCIKEITEAKDRLKDYTQADTNSSKIAVSALTNHARINMDLINLIHKGPSVRMMRSLKVKADRLARALDEERKITEHQST